MRYRRKDIRADTNCRKASLLQIPQSQLTFGAEGSSLPGSQFDKTYFLKNTFTLSKEFFMYFLDHSGI